MELAVAVAVIHINTVSIRTNSIATSRVKLKKLGFIIIIKNSKISKTKKGLIILLAACIYGLSWGLIYLLFSVLHAMTQMFNNTFIFFVASIFNIEIETKTIGFLFAFVDGFLFGLLLGFVLIRIGGNYIKSN